MTPLIHFAFVLVPQFSHLAFANAVEPLRIANLISGEELYRWSFVSQTGEPAEASNGSLTVVHHGFADVPACDRLFVLSGVGVAAQCTPALLAMLRRLRARGVALGALCSGAWVLAQAGFLDGRQAAIHWEFHDSFMEAFPDVALVRSVFVADGPIQSASGGSATADLMLHLIGQTHGEDLAISVADQMVYNAVRESSAEQRVSLQARQGIRNPRLAKAIAIMRDTLEQPMAAARIADEIGLSSRQLERLFGKFLNTTPKKYYMELRLDRARLLLLQTEMSVSEVAYGCGFESPGHFARVFKAAYGVSPVMQRSRLS